MSAWQYQFTSAMNACVEVRDDVLVIKQSSELDPVFAEKLIKLIIGLPNNAEMKFRHMVIGMGSDLANQLCEALWLRLAQKTYISLWGAKMWDEEACHVRISQTEEMCLA